MKIYTAFIATTISLCASICCPPEEDFMDETIYINNDEIIEIVNNQIEFNVGDFIYIETTIHNSQVTTENEVIDLSDYDYSEIGASQYVYTISLNKITEYGSSVEIPISFEHLDLIEGSTNITEDYFASEIRIDSYFNGENYKSLLGIKLLEPGNYFISSIYQSDAYIYINGGLYETNYIAIKSKIANSNANGFYEFTVN